MGRSAAVGLAACAAAASAVAWAASMPPLDPFAFFSPSVLLTDTDRRNLADGEVVVHTLPADDGHIAVFAATRTTAPPGALLAWTRDIAALKRNRLVLSVGRFSDAPREADVETLSLEPGELDDLRRCRVGDCDLKLAAGDIDRVHHAIAAAPADAWRDAAQQAFRGVLLDRVRQHRDSGMLALPPSADKARGVSVGAAYSSIIARSPYLTRAVPEAVDLLQAPVPATADDAFYYWSRERYGAGHAVVTVTYVRLIAPRRPGVPEAMAISTNLFASHYINGAVGVTTIVCSGAGAPCYLAYLNRTHVDVLGGVFGGIKRALIGQRLSADAPAAVRLFKQRLEGGLP